MNRSSYGEKEINMKRSHDIVSGDSDNFSSSNHVVSDSSPSGSGIASSPDIKKRIKLEADPHGTSADSRAGLPALAGRRWYQGTEYKCRVCSEVLFGSKSLLNHLQVQHQMASAEYLELVKQLGTKESYYVCQVCQKPLEHTLTVISRHLNTNHDLKIPDYEMVYDPQNFFDEDEAKAEKLLPKISSYFSCIDPVQGTSGHAAVPVYPPKADLTHRPSEHPEHSKEIDRKHFPKIEKDQYDWDSEPQILGSDLEKHLSRSFPTEVEENHSEKNDQEAENAKKAPIHVSRMPRYRWNRSSITCPLCSRIYNNYNACRTHFKNVHNLKLLRKLMNYCVRTNHTCLLCNGRVTFETNVIKRHLRKFHGVSIQMYEDQFPLELESLFSSLTEKKTPNLPISDPKKGKSTLESVSGASSKSKQPPELSETSNGNLEISKTIESFEVSMKDKADSSVRSKFQWNQSTVPCPRCPKVYNSLNGCRMHLRTTHQIKSLNDVTIENSIRLKHTCLICNTQLTFEANLLSKHLEGVHKMTILTYENKFLLELKVMFSSLIEKLPLEFVECNTSQSLPAARNLETDSQSTCGTKHDIENNDTVPERVAKVGSSEKKRKNKKKAGLNDPRFQWNQSVISCPLCSQNFNNLNGCRMHLYTTHKKKSLKNLVIKNCVRPKHTCLLCYKKVTFETLMINQHLNKIHHVSIQTYENKFSAALESLFDIISSKESANTTPKNISESLPI